jgi:hypothetical protein
MIIAALAAIGAAGSAHAQCTRQWRAYPGPILDAGVRTLLSWDPDGAGPQAAILVVGGDFLHAGSLPLSFVATWDGSAWQPIGGGVSGDVDCATLYDPDGPGPLPEQLVIGGFFSQSAGGTVLNEIARYDGSAWQPLGAGVSASGGFHPLVSTLAVFGSSLVAGGDFQFAGGIPAHGIARWDGSAWSAFTNDLYAFFALETHAGWLYAGGLFPMAFTSGLARWTGAGWQTNVGQGFPDDDVYALCTFRGRLVAGGFFTNAGNNHIAAFAGDTWQPLGSGLNGNVRALCVFDPDGPGPMPDLLIAGGTFSTAGGQPASNIAAWDGTSWTALGAGTTNMVRALTVWNNQLVVGGTFYYAGGLTSPGMALWGCPLVLPCYPNCDNSTQQPILNINDFTCFLNRFVASDPAANCDGSTQLPTLNILDFVCFLNRFAAGCS